MSEEIQRGVQRIPEEVQDASISVRQGTKGAPFASGKYYYIRNYTLDRWLDLAGCNTAPGTRILGWAKVDSINHVVRSSLSYAILKI